MQLSEGHSYTREAISAGLGGGTQDFLPHVDGKVVCGTFHPDKNPNAPEVILVGPGRDTRLRWARELHDSRRVIPVFIKVAPKHWEYVGQFPASGYTEDQTQIEKWAQHSGRPDVHAVLFLSPDGPPTSPTELATLSDIEGRTQYRIHRSRERSRLLAQAKRKRARAAGEYFCEACRFSFSTVHFPAEACAEVHHLRPISSIGRSEVETKLEDLALLCANCHRMVHSEWPPMPLSLLRERLRDGGLTTA